MENCNKESVNVRGRLKLIIELQKITQINEARRRAELPQA